MTITQLEYFIAVAETLNFTRAAENYYISQTAITQQIKTLENQLGFPLFKRNKRHVELTPAGVIYKNEAKAVLLRLEEANRKAKLAASGYSGSLHIGFLQGLETTGITEIIQSYLESFPEASLTFRRGYNKELLELIGRQELDLAFTFRPATSPSPRILYETYRQIPLFAVLPRNHYLTYKTALTRRELEQETILILEAAKEEILFGYHLSGFEPQHILYVQDISSLLMMVSASMGIAILPEYNTFSLSSMNPVQKIPLTEDKELFEIVLAYHGDGMNVCVGEFLETFHAWISR